ncbi:hypothetical protein AMJ39_01110 [candidate division TA06 bacterium DG_24]|uniref:Bacterial surface antigen (D15) domain-containing protein n=3 Tax=Bacteria division TA06 TaxID=1156500 RepID=A0A0S8JKC6_UNCT6|nr:MAG: hypothetical protein AMJ39_01110 [candidate division TA06 bacterium DG_24]KPK71653.1 MAG: hypothetical protein AMJ82_00055 [candidate division TA06 bacterium SM23_40]KPL10161.1 MAG: hypothetical protein AMJ71_04220 [candidate division TA06 bacterium SM1_40]
MRSTGSVVCGLALAAVIAIWISGSEAQIYGQNKVQYRGFEWSIRHTEHFDIYFYEGAEELVQYVADIAEAAYDRLEKDLQHSPSRQFPVIIYRCHSHFEQTNVITELIEESVGGFTEIFKTRVVVPFNGSYEDFRHVIVHELTHAFQFDLLYGDAFGSLLSRQYFYQPPLWLMEGVAEFQSIESLTETNMILRDAAIYDALIPIDRLEFYGGSFIVYKEGESVIRYVAQSYGRQKVGEILHQVRMRQEMDGALMAVIGKGAAELSEEWSKQMKRTFWPEFGSRDEAPSEAHRLTDHRVDGSFINLSPAVSPEGDKIAFFSNRNEYTDLLLISAIDGRVLRRLVKGERSAGFESLHAMESAISWTSDGQRIAVVGKSGGKDYIYIIEAQSGRLIDRIDVDLDACSSPAWSPDGSAIAFAGLMNGRQDLYLVSLGDRSVTRLTDDQFDDRDPAWNPDGNQLAFVSDRTDGESEDAVFGQYAAFVLSPVRPGGEIRRLTARGSQASRPCWSEEGTKLIYVSDASGTRNLHLYDLSDSTEARVTDLVGGVYTPSWSADGKRMAMAIYGERGWDIFTVKDPVENLTRVPTESTVADAGGTELTEMADVHEALYSEEADEPGEEAGLSDVTETEVLGETEESLPGVDEEERPEVEKYRIRFTPDWITGGLQYSTGYGFAGQTGLSFSDILGNHRIYFESDLFSNITESNFVLAYYYLPRRIDWGAAVYQQRYYYFSGDGLIALRTFGASALARYPFSRYHRLDFSLDGYVIQEDSITFVQRGYYDIEAVRTRSRAFVLLPAISFVQDNALWGVTGPVNGSRCIFSAARSLPELGSDLKFTTGYFDCRRYLRLGQRHTLALRLLGAGSMGRDRERFWLGGNETLRGYTLGDSLFGTRVGLATAELRFPFVDHFLVAFPLPVELRSVRGATFVDLGAVYEEDEDFELWRDTSGEPELVDLRLGFGAGVRVRLSFLVIRYDVGWASNLRETTRPRHYVSLGPEF